MVGRRLLSVAVGLGADQLLGEPPSAVHPVALFGRAMQGVERRCYQPTRARGVVYTATGLGLGVLAGVVVRSSAAATYVSVAGRSLRDAARDVGAALECGDLERARLLLPTLVGRDPANLDAEQISRAVVESVAENTVDAIIAPAIWALVGGAPATLGYRAVNTMDAMVGHRSERYQHFGTASARLDDVANWLAARAAALLVALVRPHRAVEVWRTVRAHSPAHPSPNSGVIEAAFAAALGVRLGGPSRYGEVAEIRPPLGFGRAVEHRDIKAASRLSRDCTIAFTAVLIAAGLGRRGRSRVRAGARA